MNRCEKCDSEEFYEEDGFYFCSQCQTQSQGFAKQIFNQEDEDFVPLKEVKLAKKVDGRKTKKSQSGPICNEPGLDQTWTSTEAFNEVFIGMIEDFLSILRRNQLGMTEDLENRFKSICMQIWFKYLRQSEIAFVRGEHQQKRYKLHPLTRYRDNYILSRNSGNDDDDDGFVPNYHYGTSTENKLGNRRSYGKNYVLRIGNPERQQNRDYFNDDIYSEKYRNPRLQFPGEKRNYSFRKQHLLKSLNRMIYENATKKPFNDPFMTLIQKLTGSDSSSENEEHSNTGTDVVIKTEPEDETDESDNNNNNTVEEEEEEEGQIPTLTKLASQVIPMEHWKGTSCKLATRDLITKPKLLIFIYIAIRLFNFNIFASDLIRWCIDDDIRFMNTFSHFQKKRQILWVDCQAFRNSKFQSYYSFLVTARDMILHCSIDPESFPVPDIYCLIQRYIKDLNLPRGLILIIKKRYGNYIEKSTGSGTFLKDLKTCTPYEVHAMAVILLTLRDLFDLNGPGQDYQSLFVTLGEKDLFYWSEWFTYSFIRFNLIKAYFLNIRPSHSETVDLDEILMRNHLWMEFFRENKLVSEKRIRSTCFEIRAKLQGLFEDIFFEPKNFEWMEKCTKHVPGGSLYPLTAFTDKIIERTSNAELKLLLSKDFRCQRITPYVCDHDLFFHRRPQLFHSRLQMENEKAFYKKFENSFGDSFWHLWELTMFITNATPPFMANYFYQAEKMAYPEMYETAKPTKSTDEDVT